MAVGYFYTNDGDVSDNYGSLNAWVVTVNKPQAIVVEKSRKITLDKWQAIEGL